MKRMKRVFMLAAMLAAVMGTVEASQKVDDLWAFVRSQGGVDASTPEGDKIRNEIEARQNALSPEEKREFEQKAMAAMMEQMQKAMKRFAEVPVDTPVAVSGQSDMRNKRTYSMTFRAEVPDTMSEDEFQRGIRQLERLRTARSIFAPTRSRRRLASPLIG